MATLSHTDQTVQTKISALETARKVAIALDETAVERDKQGGTAYHERNIIRQSGLLGLIVPKHLGGFGEDWTSVMQIVRLFASVDSSMAHIFGFQHLILASIELYGTEEQRDYYFTKTVSENIFWGNALNPLDKGTQVVEQSGHYIFTGTKGFCSGATDSDMLLVSGFLDDKLVIGVTPSNSKGIQINQDWNNFGQRQTDSGSVKFDGLSISAENMLLVPGPMGNVRSTLRSCIAQLILTHIYLGLAEGAFNEAKKYTSAQTRAWHNSGVNSAAEDPFILKRYGQMFLSLQSSVRLTEMAVSSLQQSWNLGDKITEKQRGRTAVDIALAKVQASATGLDICSQMFDVTGSRATNGFARLDRFWRNIRTHSLHDPADYKLKELGDFALNGTIPAPGFYS
ncbi:acyl-CoA dehydrogenase family protein [Pedobacter sp. AW1-32]|uniref:acyl-CoA dehydrogenase family protein n=1 Tax=Pedobacter sp. AW1-32 TaxID=3383026 RepID=UPI003FF13207